MQSLRKSCIKGSFYYNKMGFTWKSVVTVTCCIVMSYFYCFITSQIITVLFFKERASKNFKKVFKIIFCPRWTNQIKNLNQNL